MVKIEKDEFQIACKEVLEILKSVKEEDMKRIPKEEIDMLKFNADYEYDFSFNPNISLKEQKVSRPARAIIAQLYIDYIIDEERRRIINDKINHDIQMIEQQKQEKYNTDNLFNNSKQETKVEEQPIVDEVTMVKYKKSIFKRIINRIKSIFHR